MDFFADQPACESGALRRGIAILGQSEAALVLHCRSFHLALAAVFVEQNHPGLCACGLLGRLFDRHVGVGVGRIFGDWVSVGEVIFRPVERQFRIPRAHLVPFIGCGDFRDIFKLQPQLIAFAAGQGDDPVLPRAVTPGAVDHLQRHGHADRLGFFRRIGILDRRVGVGVGRILGDWVADGNVVSFHEDRRFDIPIAELVAFIGRGHVREIGQIQSQLIAFAAGQGDGLGFPRPIIPGAVHYLECDGHADLVASGLGFLPPGDGGDVFGHFNYVARLPGFLADQPAREFHTFRRGEAALRQGVFAVLVRLGRFHLALAAIGVKGDGEGFRRFDRLIGLPLGNHSRIRADEDHITGVQRARVCRLSLGFALDFGFGFLFIDLRRFRGDQPADEFGALRRGKAILRQRVGAVFIRGRRFHLARSTVSVKGDDDGLRDFLPLRDHGHARVRRDRIVRLVDPLGINGRAFVCFNVLAFGGFFRLLRRCHDDLPTGELHALRRGKRTLRQEVFAVLVRGRRFHLAFAAVRIKGDHDGLRDRLPLGGQGRVAT